MPLDPYPRGRFWWAKGTVEYNGRPISGYIRESTRATDEAGAWDWISEREEIERRRYLIGEEDRPLTFNDLLELYEPTKDMAKYLIPISAEIGTMLVRDIKPATIRGLGPKLYPNNSTDTWRRWVIAPARAVINNGHEELGARCPPIRIPGYTKEERIKQDRKRGKRSRVKKTPGSFEWLLKFRQHAGRYHAALALFMFATGARVGQATAMHPDNLNLDEGTATIPGAKGHDDREVTLPPELVTELRALKPKVPRGWDRRYKANLRVFGFAGKDGPRKGWMTACKRAGISHLPPHSAGRHGFGQEMRVRQAVDKKAVEAFGGWSPEGDMVDKTYTHAEDFEGKILEAFRTGLVQAEKETGLKLLKGVEEKPC